MHPVIAAAADTFLEEPDPFIPFFEFVKQVAGFFPSFWRSLFRLSSIRQRILPLVFYAPHHKIFWQFLKKFIICAQQVRIKQSCFPQVVSGFKLCGPELFCSAISFSQTFSAKKLFQKEKKIIQKFKSIFERLRRILKAASYLACSTYYTIKARPIKVVRYNRQLNIAATPLICPSIYLSTYFLIFFDNFCTLRCRT